MRRDVLEYLSSEYTKGVIRIGKSKMDRKHNGQKKKNKRTIIYKTL